MARKNTLRAAILAAFALPLAAQAQDVTVEELLKRLEAQEQKIRALEQKLEARDEEAAGQAPTADAEAQQQILVLERKLELQQEAADAAKASAPVVSAGTKGFQIKSADGKHQVKIGGTLHLDGRYLPGDEHGEGVRVVELDAEYGVEARCLGALRQLHVGARRAAGEDQADHAVLAASSSCAPK